MDPFSSIEGYPEYTNMIDLVAPKGIEYYFMNIKSFTPLRKVPVCIAASVYRMSAGNSMPCNQDKNDYQRLDSPWASIRNRPKTTHNLNNSDSDNNNNSLSNTMNTTSIISSSSSSSNSSTCSAMDSTCSSRADSPELNKQEVSNLSSQQSPLHHHHSKKRSYHMLLREIKRLRGENSSLRSNVAVLKNDLRDITLSRKDSDASHKKFYDEYVDKNTQLEIDLMDRDDEIRLLKEQIEELKLALSDRQAENDELKHARQHATLQNKDNPKAKKAINPFGCYEFEEDDVNLSCQPLAHESALPEVDIKMDELKQEDDSAADYFRRRFLEDNEETNNNPSNDEEDDDDEQHQLTFDHVAVSYIHQAILSKLSSARVRLELDDLILKYEPTPENIAHVLASSFVTWICSLLTKWVDKTSPQPTTATTVFTTKIQSGIIEFWQSLLQYYTTQDDCQRYLLNSIETGLDLVSSPRTAIVDHFDRLIVMLYKYHVVDDDAVVDWWEHPFNTDVSKKIRKITTRFIEWVQAEDDDDEEDSDEEDSDEEDDEDNNDESDDDEDDDCGIDFDYDDDDDDAVEDDEIEFSYAESPLSEETAPFEDSSDIELHTNSLSDHDSLDHLLNTKEREICVCHLDKDTIPSSSQKHEPLECSCNIYSPSPSTEKKKKSVRIAL